MNSICPEINLAINLALSDGNEIKERSEGWSKAKQVIMMKGKLTAEMRDSIKKSVPKLEYWVESGSPQNDPEEGFFCNECSVGLSFPCERKIII